MRCCLFVVSENEGTSAVQLSYADRLRLSALTKQVSHGAFSADVATDVGLLDVFGNDQRYSQLLTYLVYVSECCCVSLVMLKSRSHSYVECTACS